MTGLTKPLQEVRGKARCPCAHALNEVSEQGGVKRRGMSRDSGSSQILGGLLALAVCLLIFKKCPVAGLVSLNA